MPKISITNKKGLVQSQGEGFESEKMPNTVVTHSHSVTTLTPAAANAEGVSYGGKFFVLASKDNKYQLYFSSIGGTAQTVPSALDGHSLVAIGDIAADAAAAVVAAAIVTAIGAGAAAGISDLTAVNSGANVSISTIFPERSAVPSSLGSLDSTHFTAFNQLKRGSGLSSVSLRPGAVNIIDSPDFGGGHTAINIDGTAAPDVAKFTLGSGDFVGQECTIARAKQSSNATEATIIFVLALRHLDGGGIVSADEITLDTGTQADGSPLLKCVWDGSAWMSLMGVAETHLGWQGSTAAD